MFLLKKYITANNNLSLDTYIHIGPIPSVKTDKKNLCNDYSNVKKDMSKAFKDYQKQHSNDKEKI